MEELDWVQRYNWFKQSSVQLKKDILFSIYMNYFELFLDFALYLYLYQVLSIGKKCE